MANSKAHSENPEAQEAVLTRELHLLRKELHLANSWKHKLLFGILTGFGTVMGATVVVALVLYILAQLATIEFFRPVVEWVVQIVQSSRR